LIEFSCGFFLFDSFHVTAPLSRLPTHWRLGRGHGVGFSASAADGLHKNAGLLQAMKSKRRKRKKEKKKKRKKKENARERNPSRPAENERVETHFWKT
jgi:hypothetical protein